MPGGLGPAASVTEDHRKIGMEWFKLHCTIPKHDQNPLAQDSLIIPLYVFTILLAQSVRKEIEGLGHQAGVGSFSEFEPIQVRSQVVAGTNYFMKIRTGPGHFIHARLFQALPHAGGQITVSSVQFGKKESEDLSYFQ